MVVENNGSPSASQAPAPASVSVSAAAGAPTGTRTPTDSNNENADVADAGLVTIAETSTSPTHSNTDINLPPQSSNVRNNNITVDEEDALALALSLVIPQPPNPTPVELDMDMELDANMDDVHVQHHYQCQRDHYHYHNHSSCSELIPGPGGNHTAPPTIQATPVASSNYMVSNEEIIQSAEKFLNSFFTQSVTDHQAYKQELRQSLLALSTSTSRSLKVTLELLKSSLKSCKKNIRSLMEISATRRNKSVRHIHLLSYTESLKRVEKVAEKTYKALCHFLKFGMKIGALVLLKETQAFSIFSDFLIDIKSLIITLAYSNMFTELASQQNLLNELRVSVEVGLARGSKSTSHHQHQSSSKSKVQQEEWREVQNIFEFQVKTCPGNSRKFLADFNRIAHEFYGGIMTKAEDLGKHNQSHEEKFNSILGDIRLRFPLSVLESIRHRKVQMSVKPSETKVYTIQQSGVGVGSGGSIRPSTATESMGNFVDTSILLQMDKEFPQKPSNSKKNQNLVKLITSWEKYITGYFKLHSSHRKSTANLMRKSFLQYFEKTSQILTSYRIEACIKTRRMQKSLMKVLRSRIKTMSKLQHERNQIPSAVDIMDLEIVEMGPGARSRGGTATSTCTGSGAGADDTITCSLQKPRSVDKYLMKIEAQNAKVHKIYHKWTTLYSDLVKRSAEEFSLIIFHNQRHIDTWLFRDTLVQTAEIIVPSFQDEVKVLFDEAFEMVQNLISRLKLDGGRNRNKDQNQNQNNQEGETSDEENPEDNFTFIIENHRRHLNNFVTSFVVQFNTALLQYSQHLEYCCQIIHNFSLNTRDLTRKSLFHVHKSLVSFAKAQDHPGMSRIVVTSSSRNDNVAMTRPKARKRGQVAPGAGAEGQGQAEDENVDEEEEDDAGDVVEDENDRILKNYEEAVANNQPLFVPTTLPQSPLWTKSANPNANVDLRSREKEKEKEKKKSVDPNTRSLVVGRTESQKQFQKDFVQNWVKISETEKGLPTWVNNNPNSL